MDLELLKTPQQKNFEQQIQDLNEQHLKQINELKIQILEENKLLSKETKTKISKNPNLLSKNQKMELQAKDVITAIPSFRVI